jgi:hypothetical protein
MPNKNESFSVASPTVTEYSTLIQDYRNMTEKKRMAWYQNRIEKGGCIQKSGLPDNKNSKSGRGNMPRFR